MDKKAFEIVLQTRRIVTSCCCRSHFAFNSARDFYTINHFNDILTECEKNLPTKFHKKIISYFYVLIIFLIGTYNVV